MNVKLYVDVAILFGSSWLSRYVILEGNHQDYSRTMDEMCFMHHK